MPRRHPPSGPPGQPEGHPPQEPPEHQPPGHEPPGHRPPPTLVAAPGVEHAIKLVAEKVEGLGEGLPVVFPPAFIPTLQAIAAGLIGVAQSNDRLTASNDRLTEAVNGLTDALPKPPPGPAMATDVFLTVETEQLRSN